MSAAAPSYRDFPELDDAACQRALALLLDVGTSIALELKTPNGGDTPATRATAFERVSLAVRRTIILSRHLAENRPVSPETRRAQARKEIVRKVEDTIERQAEPAQAENLRAELVERLDSPEFAADLATRSPAELITELCRDLGLAGGTGGIFRRRTPADIARLCAQAAAPPSPERNIASLSRESEAMRAPPPDQPSQTKPARH